MTVETAPRYISTGELARRAGVSATTIRRYEALGLLPVAARVEGLDRRMWPADAVEALREAVEERRLVTGAGAR